MKIIHPAEQPAASDVKKARSNIVIPYNDLEQSIKVVQLAHDNGGGRCTPEQLAPWLGYTSTKSGTYMMRFYSAKYFGLIAAEKGVISATDRALAIIAPILPEDADRAKVEAFLNVPLFASVYERFKGQALPPEGGLKNLFKGTFHVPEKRLAQALSVFYASAETAGLFGIAGDRSRLISPVVSGPAQRKDIPAAKEESITPLEKPRSGSGSGGDGPRGIHEAISGLLRDLPAPGTYWPAPKKKRFLDAFKATIDHIYPEEDSP